MFDKRQHTTKLERKITVGFLTRGLRTDDLDFKPFDPTMNNNTGKIASTITLTALNLRFADKKDEAN